MIATNPVRAQKPVVLVLSTIAALVLAEIGARVYVHARNGSALATALAESAPPEPGRPVALADVIQLSSDERIVYELKPGLAGIRFKDARLDTNALGFRGPEVPPRTAATLTVVGVGDSILFGHGVEYAETYFALLESYLRELYPERRWRFVNTGVPGYNTAMEVAALRAKALALEPDLVLLHIVPNDLALPVYVRAEDDVLDPRRSFLLELLRSRSDESPARRAHAARVGRDPRLARAKGYVGEELPARYAELVGWDAFAGALDELAELEREHGFAVVTFTTVESELSREMLAEAGRHGWPHVALLPEIDAHLTERYGAAFDPDDTEVYMHSDLVVSPTNGHPSPIQHRMAARKLLLELARTGTLDALLR